jgi:hypothetical protein
MKVYWLALLMALSCIVSPGCGGGAAENGSGSGGTAAETEGDEADGSAIKRRKVDSLPAVGAYLPPMDDGRIRVAPPEGWRPVARDSKYLARFVKGDASELPRIAITVADSPSPEVTNVTEENVEELIGPLTAKSKEGKRKPIEPVRPILLGDHVFARHVRIARMNDEPVAIVALQTVRDGQMYTVELYVNAGSDGNEYAKYLKQSQDAAYAVAANLKFGDDPAPVPEPLEAPADEAKPTDNAPENKTPTEE